MRELGFNKDLFILAFDHRSSFTNNFFKTNNQTSTAEQARKIRSLKKIIYDGFKQALTNGVPPDHAGILIDEHFGREIAEDASKMGYVFAMPVEKSGLNEFDFEYGHQFENHIREFNPTFVKALVRYNPEASDDINHRQLLRLKRLSDFCHRSHFKFMFELIVPSNGTEEFDRTTRPKLMCRAMSQIQSFGVEPDLWKLEGIDNANDSHSVVRQARSSRAREFVSVVVLGRGESEERVRDWLNIGAQTLGVVGFAIGRTVFWNALRNYCDGSISREKAVTQIASLYQNLCETWLHAKKKAA